MNDWKHLQDSVLLRQTGELPEAESRQLASRLEGDEAGTRYDREAQTLMTLYKQSAIEDVPATPELTLERILREGRKKAAMDSSPHGGLWMPLKLAAGIGVILVGIGAALFYLRQKPATDTQTWAASSGGTRTWEYFESSEPEQRLAELGTQLAQAKSGSDDVVFSSEEDLLAQELLELEKDST